MAGPTWLSYSHALFHRELATHPGVLSTQARAETQNCSEKEGLFAMRLAK